MLGSSRRLLVLGAAAATLAGVLVGPAGGEHAVGADHARRARRWHRPGIVVEDGMTQPVFPVDRRDHRDGLGRDQDRHRRRRRARPRRRRDRAAGRDRRRAAQGRLDRDRVAVLRVLPGRREPPGRLPPAAAGGRSSPAPLSLGEAGSATIGDRVALAEATRVAIRDRFLARGYATVSAQTIGTTDSDRLPDLRRPQRDAVGRRRCSTGSAAAARRTTPRATSSRRPGAPARWA